MASIAGHAGGLPATSHVFLAEFFTWVLDGVARYDAAVKQLAIQQCDRNTELWGDPFGPGWLSHLLELIRDGHEAYPKRDAADDQTHEINQHFFVLAQRWLESHGGSAEDALAEVEHKLARRQDRDPRHIELERLLYDRASAGKVIVKARKWDDVKRCAASEYQPVPADFFLRPCRFFYSIFHGPSELVRWPENGSPNWLADSVFNRNDPPVSYVEAKITREDAIAVAAEFWDAERNEGAMSDAEHSLTGWWKPTWLTLAGAIMWVVTGDRSLARAADQMEDNDRSTILGIEVRLAAKKCPTGKSVSARMEVDAAWPAIRRLIADEKIMAEGSLLERRGITSGIETRYPNAPIPSGDAGNLIITGGVAGIEPRDALGPDELYRFTNGQGRYWYDVRLRAADVFREFPNVGAQRPVNLTEKRGPGPGAHTKTQYSALRVEALRLMEHHGEFSDDDIDWNGPEKLISALQEFHMEKYKREPGRSTLQPKVRDWINEYRCKGAADK